MHGMSTFGGPGRGACWNAAARVVGSWLLLVVSLTGCAGSPALPGASEAAARQGSAATPAPAGALSHPAAGSPSATAISRLPGEPDPRLTPGAFNPAVTQDTIRSTICVRGWTATVRPPASYTDALKARQIEAYGYADTSLADYEEDHLVPLELGGSPPDPRNLWPEPRTATLADGRPSGASIKDEFETALKKAVCAGSMTLARARREIGDHWVHYFYGLALGG